MYHHLYSRSIETIYYMLLSTLNRCLEHWLGLYCGHEARRHVSSIVQTRIYMPAIRTGATALDVRVPGLW